MNIIGVSGLAGSGKDTVADILVEHRGFVKIALADPMKRFVKPLFGFTNEQLWGTSELRNAPIFIGGFRVSPRETLQKLGSDWGRALYRDVWVDEAIRTAKILLENPRSRYSPHMGIYYEPEETVGYKGVIISDVRFRNEADAIVRHGGKVFRKTWGNGLDGVAAKHISENELNLFNYDFHAIIHGFEDKKDLVARVLSVTE